MAKGQCSPPGFVTLAVSPAAPHLSPYRNVWEMHALLPGFGSRGTSKMTTEVVGRRGWGRHLAGSRLFLSQC